MLVCFESFDRLLLFFFLLKFPLPSKFFFQFFFSQTINFRILRLENFLRLRSLPTIIFNSLLRSKSTATEALALKCYKRSESMFYKRKFPLTKNFYSFVQSSSENLGNKLIKGEKKTSKQTTKLSEKEKVETYFRALNASRISKRPEKSNANDTKNIKMSEISLLLVLCNEN